MEWRPWGFTEAVAAQSCSWLPQAETRFVGFQQTNLIKLTGAICFELCSLLAESVENLARVFFSLSLCSVPSGLQHFSTTLLGTDTSCRGKGSDVLELESGVCALATKFPLGHN